MSRWHIFPNGPMCSLRRALMLWLVPMFLLVGAGSAGVTYWSYVNMVGMFLDDQMEQLADALITNEMPQPPQLTAERVQQWGAYIVQTWGPDGSLQVTSFPDAHVPLQASPGFHEPPSSTVVTPIARARDSTASASSGRWPSLSTTAGGPANRRSMRSSARVADTVGSG